MSSCVKARADGVLGLSLWCDLIIGSEWLETIGPVKLIFMLTHFTTGTQTRCLIPAVDSKQPTASSLVTWCN